MTRKIAIVGAGVIGSMHGVVISQLGDRLELVAVVDPVAERAQQIVDAHGGRPYASLAEALSSTEIDVVAVCTPTGLHGVLAIEALTAGKDVIIEKPAEITVERTDEIIAAQQAAGRLVTVISQHRFDPATEVTIEAIAKGELGRLTSGIASIDWWRGQSYYDSGDWRGTWELDGGGALMNQGVHTIDLLVATLGRPVEVFAYTGTLAHERIEVEDVAVGVVRFENGALGVLHASTAAYPGMSARLQVHGDRGSVIIDSDKLSFIHRTPVETSAQERAYGGSDAGNNQVGDFPEASGAALTAGADPGALGTIAHRRQYENFLAALDGAEPIRVDLETNRQAIAIITGVYESSRTGRPVSLA
jgi:UDP-N-acetyl-2-amino-2-deoxyglucuronate dehydrogenase